MQKPNVHLLVAAMKSYRVTDAESVLREVVVEGASADIFVLAGCKRVRRVGLMIYTYRSIKTGLLINFTVTKLKNGMKRYVL